MKNIIIDGVEYIAKQKEDDKPFVIIRTYSAGVFAGNLISRDGTEVVLYNAIRIWSWEGAFTLSQLAIDGTKKPQECNFAKPLDEITLTQAIEIIPTTDIAEKSIKSVIPHEI